jgi:hypothetical protein
MAKNKAHLWFLLIAQHPRFGFGGIGFLVWTNAERESEQVVQLIEGHEALSVIEGLLASRNVK